MTTLILQWGTIAWLACTAYLAVGVVYLCMRERPRGMSLESIMEPVVWWLPDLVTGNLSGFRWRTSYMELFMGLALAVCLLFQPVSTLVQLIW